ncbi:MAG: hypothetical protein WC370_05595 [Dehalococcoidales bacterium]|jgi:hypothetical protein
MADKETLYTVLDPRGQPTGIFGRKLDSDANPTDILDLNIQPTTSQASFESFRMAPRLDKLEGKTIYLVDVGFVGGFDFLTEVNEWFGRNMPSVKTVLLQKPGSMFSDAPELWAEIKEKADAAIVGVGG